MSTLHTIGGRVASTALALLGAGAGIASFATADTTAGEDTDSIAQPVAHQQIKVLDVVPQPGVPYVLECRAEAGSADGEFLWKVCVPDESPDGGPVVFDTITENGEAEYADGWHIIGTGETTPQGNSVNADRTVTVDKVTGQWDEPVGDCDTDAECAAWDESQGQVPSGYGAERAATMQHVAFTSGGSCSEPLPAPSGGNPTTTPQPQPRPLVNLNTATGAELDALPGIGTVLAARIVENRPYSTVNDLHRVKYIPTKVFPLVTV